MKHHIKTLFHVWSWSLLQRQSCSQLASEQQHMLSVCAASLQKCTRKHSVTQSINTFKIKTGRELQGSAAHSGDMYRDVQRWSCSWCFMSSNKDLSLKGCLRLEVIDQRDITAEEEKKRPSFHHSPPYKNKDIKRNIMTDINRNIRPSCQSHPNWVPFTWVTYC